MGARAGGRGHRSATAARLIAVTLGAQEYALPAGLVREIVPYAEPRPVPGSAMHVEGVITLRGAVVPVIDLRTRLGAGGVRAVAPAIVVVGLPGQTLGIVVDEVREVPATRDPTVLDVVRLLGETPLAP